MDLKDEDRPDDSVDDVNIVRTDLAALQSRGNSRAEFTRASRFDACHLSACIVAKTEIGNRHQSRFEIQLRKIG